MEENKAVACPVCKGSGKYEDRECHGCLKNKKGIGWVEISGSADENVDTPNEQLLCEVPCHQLELQLNG